MNNNFGLGMFFNYAFDFGNKRHMLFNKCLEFKYTVSFSHPLGDHLSMRKLPLNHSCPLKIKCFYSKLLKVLGWLQIIKGTINHLASQREV